MKILDLLPAYKQFLRYELQRAKQTEIAYLSDLRGLTRILDKPVEEITKNDIRAYMLARGEQGISRATVRRSVGGMSTFWKWMMDEGYVMVNVTSGIVLPAADPLIRPVIPVRGVTSAFSEASRKSTAPIPIVPGLLCSFATLAAIRLVHCGDIRLLLLS